MSFGLLQYGTTVGFLGTCAAGFKKKRLTSGLIQFTTSPRNDSCAVLFKCRGSDKTLAAPARGLV